jgi:hypothetical protein
MPRGHEILILGLILEEFDADSMANPGAIFHPDGSHPPPPRATGGARLNAES